MKTVQTVVYKKTINSEARPIRVRVVTGDQVEKINRGPSYSYSGSEYYLTARLVTSADRKAQWYKNAQFDSEGNSDNL